MQSTRRLWTAQGVRRRSRAEVVCVAAAYEVTCVQEWRVSVPDLAICEVLHWWPLLGIVQACAAGGAAVSAGWALQSVKNQFSCGRVWKYTMV